MNDTPFNRVLVCGGRAFRNISFIESELDRLRASHYFQWDSLIIHGDADGTDRLAGAWAARRGLACMAMAANWNYFGPHAGTVRNTWMIKLAMPNLIVAFPGGEGTADTCFKANQNQIQVLRLAP